MVFKVIVLLEYNYATLTGENSQSYFYSCLLCLMSLGTKNYAGIIVMVIETNQICAYFKNPQSKISAIFESQCNVSHLQLGKAISY